MLDNYHVITSETIHQELFHIISHLPPHVDVVVLSRVAPPYPIGRMRVQGDLVETWSGDLRFILAETRAFLKDTRAIEERDALAAVYQQIKGWAALPKVCRASPHIGILSMMSSKATTA